MESSTTHLLLKGCRAIIGVTHFVLVHLGATHGDSLLSLTQTPSVGLSGNDILDSRTQWHLWVLVHEIDVSQVPRPANAAEAPWEVWCLIFPDALAACPACALFTCLRRRRPLLFAEISNSQPKSPKYFEKHVHLSSRLLSVINIDVFLFV